MRILALDLATKTGWATNITGALEAGTWTLATPAEVRDWGKQRITRRKDPRVQRLVNHLEKYCGHVDMVVFEDVEFASSTFQVQLWSSLRAAVWLFCGGSVLTEAVPVGTLKKYATGNGAADKPAMSRALKSQYPSIWSPKYDDNAIDACWLYLWAKHTLSRSPIK